MEKCFPDTTQLRNWGYGAHVEGDWEGGGKDTSNPLKKSGRDPIRGRDVDGPDKLLRQLLHMAAQIQKMQEMSAPRTKTNPHSKTGKDKGGARPTPVTDGSVKTSGRKRKTSQKVWLVSMWGAPTKSGELRIWKSNVRKRGKKGVRIPEC